MRKEFLLAGFFFVSILATAQHPLEHWTDAVEIRYDSRQPVIHYLLTVDANDLSSFSVEMQIKNIPDSFQVAMVAHPEYDDRYWRFIENFSVRSKNGNGTIVREDSSLWKIKTSGGEAIIHYKIHLPNSANPFRSSWKAFLSPTGGLVGGPHSFMYVVGATLAPSYVTLKLPEGWNAATGLQSTSDPNTFFASSVFVLIDDPVLIGKFKSWSFAVDNVPHRVVYLPTKNEIDFDTTKLVSSIQKIVEEAARVFGRLPYREFTFMLQDGAGGSLEHNNSVTIGAPVTEIKNDPGDILSEISHEYFHTWNLVRIHPVEYTDVEYKTPAYSRSLWFSEGLTMFYADLILRRAGLPVFDSTRIKHLEHLIRRYSITPAFTKFSAEKISLAEYDQPGILGDYEASTHLQGELIGSMLDLIIRNSTHGKSSIEDVMRKMMEKYSGRKGFTSENIQEVVQNVCKCDLHSFFNDYVFGSKQIDFNKYLALTGLRSPVTWTIAKDENGNPYPDLRVYAWQKRNDPAIRMGITDPMGCWGKAGLHTGDILVSVNGKEIKTTNDFRLAIRSSKIGDTVVIEVLQKNKIVTTKVIISDQQQAEVHITELLNSTEKQKKLREGWLTGY